MAGVSAAGQRVSFTDMEKWPDDGRRYELYDGEVFVVPSPLPLHQFVLARLYLVLEDYVRAHGGVVLFAPLDIVLTDFDVVQPDILLFTAERAHLIHPRRVTRVAPDLAVEILSPGTARNDRGRKRELLARHAVREYWLVDPEVSRVEVFALKDRALVPMSTATGEEPLHSPTLPELEITPADLVPTV
jgi:Uma2 family endonuclease